MVVAAASTASTITITNSSRVAIATERTNSGIRSGFILFGFVLIVVGMKLAMCYPVVWSEITIPSEKLTSSIFCIWR
jgi:hypothetical protein